jgi:hypothetical protein
VWDCFDLLDVLVDEVDENLSGFVFLVWADQIGPFPADFLDEPGLHAHSHVAEEAFKRLAGAVKCIARSEDIGDAPVVGRMSELSFQKADRFEPVPRNPKLVRLEVVSERTPFLE